VFLLTNFIFFPPRAIFFPPPAFDEDLFRFYPRVSKDPELPFEHSVGFSFLFPNSVPSLSFFLFLFQDWLSSTHFSTLVFPYPYFLLRPSFRFLPIPSQRVSPSPVLRLRGPPVSYFFLTTILSLFPFFPRTVSKILWSSTPFVSFLTCSPCFPSMQFFLPPSSFCSDVKMNPVLQDMVELRLPSPSPFNTISFFYPRSPRAVLIKLRFFPPAFSPLCFSLLIPPLY